MKKLLLTLFAGIFINTAFSQSIPNGGFENWTAINFENPQYWNTSNGSTTSGGSTTLNVSKTTDSYHGGFAVQLNTVLLGSDTAGPFLANGDPTHPAGQGIPYNQNPTSMRFHYKCNVMPGDTALVMIFFKLGGTVISQNIKKITGIQNAYTLGTINLSLGVTPDSLIFAATSSNLLAGNFRGIPGSMLQIDSVFFTGVTSQPLLFNGDFETWQAQTVDKLTGWEISGKSGAGGQSYKTSDAYSGAYALELMTHGNGTANPDNATTGHSISGGTIGGYPYSLQTDTLIYYYKYTPNDINDSAKIQLDFKKNGLTIAGVSKLLPAKASYTKDSIILNLASAPDSLIIFINSSKSYTVASTFIGADLKIDNLSFKSQLVPVADFSLPNTFCVGQTFQLTDISTNIPTAWTWALVGSGFLSSTTAQNPTLTYNAPGTHTISLVASNGYGTSNIVYHTINIVSPPSIAVSSPTICNGGQANVTASGASTYVWNTGAITQSINVSPSITTTYVVTGTDVNGCTTGPASSTVTVNQLPVPNPGNNGPICENQNLLLTSAGGFNNYVWAGPNAFSSAQQNPAINNAMQSSGGIYTLTVADANSCVNTVTLTVIINSLPVITTNSEAICLGQQTATLTASGASTYSWSPQTGISAATGSVVTANYTTTIVYTITGTDGNNCSSTGTSTVTVNPLPVPAVTSNGPVCINQTLNLFSSGGVSYSWAGPSAFSSSMQNPSLPNAQVTASGIYTVTVTDANSCIASDTVSGIVNTCASINKYADNLVAVYPNPSSGVFTISLADANAVACVFDLTGKKVASFKLTDIRSQIDLSSFTDGIYFIEISTVQGTFHKKITKAN